MSLYERLRRLLRGGAVSASPPGDEGASASCKQITCAEAFKKVHEYLDGELDHVSHEEVAQHFSKCKKCYPHLHLEERFRDLLHRSQEGEVCPDHLRGQVMELLAAEAGEPS
jgi:mycothiol system anti-sigma-R factor